MRHLARRTQEGPSWHSLGGHFSFALYNGIAPGLVTLRNERLNSAFPAESQK